MATSFATTWWGRAWVDALENSAALEPTRLSRGRLYARNGSVGPITISAGYAKATVRGSHRETYQTDVAVKTLAASEWDQIAESIAGTARHAAALLDGELDPGVVDDALRADVSLLPKVGDLRPDCSCPDWAEPCKHAAALCYLLAAEIDRDPFQLFQLRGRGRDELMAMVRAHRTAGTNNGGAGALAASPVEIEGVEAAEAWAGRSPDDLLAPPPEIVASRPHVNARLQRFERAAWDVDMPPHADISVSRIDELADDAVARARSMLADGASSGLQAPGRADLARWAARLGDGAALDRLGSRVGIPAAKLRQWAAAWRVGGDGGVAVTSDDAAWSIDQDGLDAGREQLVELGHPRRSISLNYDSLRMTGNIWLVIGPDGRWYKLEGGGKHQDVKLVAPPSADITDLVDPPR